MLVSTPRGADQVPVPPASGALLASALASLALASALASLALASALALLALSSLALASALAPFALASARASLGRASTPPSGSRAASEARSTKMPSWEPSPGARSRGSEPSGASTRPHAKEMQHRRATQTCAREASIFTWCALVDRQNGFTFFLRAG